MSVSSKENQDQDFQVEQAIADGKRQTAEVEPEVEITLQFSDEQKNMIEELTSALSLSVEVLLETAIGYVYYRYKKYPEGNKLEFNHQPNNKSEDAHQTITNLSKHRRLLIKKLTLAAETSHKLEELGMEKKINECVVKGLNLLSNKLINGK